MGKRKYFFGWQNIRYGIKEFIKIYSGSQSSFFSKKRIESAIAFIVAQYGMIYYLMTNISVMTSSDIAIWAGLEFTIAGYMVYQIQKQKKSNDSTTNTVTTDDDEEMKQ